MPRSGSFYAVDRYYQATGDRLLVEELRPALEEIIHYYRNGTDFGIRMDGDGLIIAAAPGWQLTWMDAKVGDWVVTPRMGKPVEINALWYNALRVMEAFGEEFGWPGDYGELAEQVRKASPPSGTRKADTCTMCWASTPDARLRPNQIFAVSLPYSPLDLARAKRVVSTVERYLLTPYGLRTLAPQDPEYRGMLPGRCLGARRRLSPGHGLGLADRAIISTLICACIGRSDQAKSPLPRLAASRCSRMSGTRASGRSRRFSTAIPRISRAAPSARPGASRKCCAPGRHVVLSRVRS